MQQNTYCNAAQGNVDVEKALTAANSQKLIKQEALAAPVRANDHNRHYRARDISYGFKPFLAYSKFRVTLDGLYERKPIRRSCDS